MPKHVFQKKFQPACRYLGRRGRRSLRSVRNLKNLRTPPLLKFFKFFRFFNEKTPPQSKRVGRACCPASPSLRGLFFLPMTEFLAARSNPVHFFLMRWFSGLLRVSTLAMTLWRSFRAFAPSCLRAFVLSPPPSSLSS